MAKDAYYFTHDSNSKDDPKCVLLIEQLGLEGYGAFWVLVETLRDQPNYKYPVALIPAIARRFNTSTEKIKAVIFNYGLFKIENDEFFFSESLIIRMKHLENKREQARLAGLRSAEIRKIGTDVQRSLSEGSTSKVKLSKVKQFIEPSYEEVKNYCLERNNNVDPNKWINFYQSKGWMVGKNKMKDWKAAIRTWESKITNKEPVLIPSKPTHYINHLGQKIQMP